MKKGYIQVYTGNGKGKSTAAFGLAMRAAGTGFKVIIIQFLKGQEYSEHASFKKLGIDYELYGTKEFIIGEPSEEIKELARKGIKRALKAFEEGYDVVILDEVNVSVHMKVLSVGEVMEVIKAKPEGVELVLTGRYAPEEFIEIADLVTEMKEIKHYYQKGVQARRGIEM
ncbi:MAG: cob(I)yrinic acid a,c-diamide adenosyltransferase [Thermotogaceae bacterium]|nr:cob(I)yrinic acid a,c-diamide adenosyltransferase [Thermotogaceae bacterium]